MKKNRGKENGRVKPRFKIHIRDTEYNVKIIDISTTGAHIETTNKYHMGDTCTLSINMGTEGETTSLSGKVIWGELQKKLDLNDADMYEYGLAFQQTGSIDTLKIIDLVLAHIK